MENEPQSNNLPIQSSSEILPTASASTHVSKVLLFTLLALIIAAGLIFIGIQVGKNQTLNEQPAAIETNVPPTQTATDPSPTPITNNATDSAVVWKTYTAAKYSFKYPSEWIVDEKCAKLEYPTNNFCIYSSEYQPVTQKIDPPGEGGIDTLTEYNVGTFLSIGVLNNIPYDSTAFCSPGGPVTISNCREKTLNANRYATREIGSYPYPAISVNAWLLVNNNGVIDLSFSFSKANKIADLQIFDQILASFRLTN